MTATTTATKPAISKLASEFFGYFINENESQMKDNKGIRPQYILSDNVTADVLALVKAVHSSPILGELTYSKEADQYRLLYLVDSLAEISATEDHPTVKAGSDTEELLTWISSDPRRTGFVNEFIRGLAGSMIADTNTVESFISLGQLGEKQEVLNIVREYLGTVMSDEEGEDDGAKESEAQGEVPKVPGDGSSGKEPGSEGGESS